MCLVIENAAFKTSIVVKVSTIRDKFLMESRSVKTSSQRKTVVIEMHAGRKYTVFEIKVLYLLIKISGEIDLLYYFFAKPFVLKFFKYIAHLLRCERGKFCVSLFIAISSFSGDSLYSWFI